MDLSASCAFGRDAIIYLTKLLSNTPPKIGWGMLGENMQHNNRCFQLGLEVFGISVEEYFVERREAFGKRKRYFKRYEYSRGNLETSRSIVKTRVKVESGIQTPNKIDKFASKGLFRC